MKRAAVLIGVDKTGGLPKLSDAAAGAERMEAWALAQGMARKDVVLLTDRQGPVTLAATTDAITALVDRGTIEQLIVYFAGHGVMVAYGEYWLLSGAPRNVNEAVNVAGSVTAARRCGIPHVVFISDACRTAAAGAQAQSVRGGEIFPNDRPVGPGRPVDWFFATTVGNPALELRADGSADGDFRAVYTTALIDAVSGKVAGALAAGPTGARPAFVVRPWALNDALIVEMPKRIAALGFGSAVTQEPEAIINSRPETAWIAGFELDPQQAVAAAAAPASAAPGAIAASPASAGADPGDAAPIRERPATRGRSAAAPSAPSVEAPRSLPVATALAARRERAAAFRDAVLSPLPAPVAAAPSLFGRTRSTRAAAPSAPAPPRSPAAQPFGPMSFETGRGFKLRGATVKSAASAHLQTEVFDDDRSVVRVGHDDGRPGLVLLELAENGTGVLLPSVPEWIVALDVVDGEIANIAWEPSERTGRHADFQGRADEVRELRARVAEAAREGVFRLDVRTAAALAPRMQSAKSVDPALGLYAAYAYHQIQDDAALQHVADALRDDLGIGLFDLELLCGRIPAAKKDDRRLPPFPLLQQGWNLLGALGATLPAELAPLRGELVDALWTQFTPAGVERLRRLVAKGTLP